MRLLYLLLVFVPVGLISEYAGGPPLLTFGAAALGVMPLAGIVDEATEDLAARTGPRVGGLRNGRQRFDRVHAGIDSTMLVFNESELPA